MFVAAAALGKQVCDHFTLMPDRSICIISLVVVEIQYYDIYIVKKAIDFNLECDVCILGGAQLHPRMWPFK